MKLWTSKKEENQTLNRKTYPSLFVSLLVRGFKAGRHIICKINFKNLNLTNMKKIIFITLILITLVSCEKEEFKPSPKIVDSTYYIKPILPDSIVIDTVH